MLKIDVALSCLVHQTSPNQRLTTHWQFFPAEDIPIVITSGVSKFGTSNPTVPIEIWHPMASARKSGASRAFPCVERKTLSFEPAMAQPRIN